MKLVIKAGAKQQSVTVKTGTPLREALAGSGFAVLLPCGGRGSCGRCRVRASGSLSPLTPQERRSLSEEAQRGGFRLLCQTAVMGDACVELQPEDSQLVVAGVSPGDRAPGPDCADTRDYFAAVDFGTTTVAARLYTAGESAGPVASAGRRNPQAAFGADVLSRMERAQAGEAPALRRAATACLDEIFNELLEQAPGTGRIREAVITGNTAMLYLLANRDTACLSRAPFLPEYVFGESMAAEDLGLCAVKDARVYLPRCASAFIGADCLCAMLACGMLHAKAPCALLDLGTNGEIALFDGASFWCASTAAGPAFEGAGISMGMPAAPGAIDHVARTGFQIRCTTIQGAPARGICGSGLIDAVAVLRQCGILGQDGAILREGHPFRAMVCEIGSAPAVRFAGTGVALTQADIRALQLAKAAVGAGLKTLLHRVGLAPEQLERLYLAGGFGQFLHMGNAAQIGLFPSALLGKTQAVGNAALDGAALLASHPEARGQLAGLAEQVRTVSLAENPFFERAYLEEMCFSV